MGGDFWWGRGMVGAPEIPPEVRKRLEKMGAPQVRQQMLMGGIVDQSLRAPAVWWLAELAEADKKRAEADRERVEAAMVRSIALQVEQTRLAQSANKAVWVAACVAIGAAVVAVIAWIHPIH
jgi:hypothetical protein